MKRGLLILLPTLVFSMVLIAQNQTRSVQTIDNYKNLDVNQVDAYYMNDGRMFWDGVGFSKYEVPKGSGKTPLFATGLWFSGESSNNGVHTSVATFNTNGNDLFPGPLKVSGVLQGQTNATSSQAYDKIWKVSVDDTQNHLANYESTDYVVPDNIATWPAHGNTSDAYAENLAPFVDVNENGIYEPAMGEYPCIKGDMSLYWILNDNLEAHTEVTGSQAMGIEVHVQAYAFNCTSCSSPTINYTTFLNWRVINRSATNYTGFNAGLWTDADLGYPMDDYIGTHVGLNSMYFYNGTDVDGTGEGNSYGENPPAMFISVLDGPQAPGSDGIDNDNNGTIDEAGEKQLLSAMMFHNSDMGIQGRPETAAEYNNYLNGKWKTGENLTFGGTGYHTTGGVTAKYMFPGDSDPWLNGTLGVDPNYTTAGGWTEFNESNAPQDKRGLAAIGPVDFNAGEELEYTIALIFSRGDDGAMSSVTKGFQETESMIDVFNSTDIHACNYIYSDVEEVQANVNVEIFPNPTTESFVIKGVSGEVNYKIYSIDGTLLKEGNVDAKPVDIGSYPNGIYLVEIIQKENKQSIKLIKE